MVSPWPIDPLTFDAVTYNRIEGAIKDFSSFKATLVIELELGNSFTTYRGVARGGAEEFGRSVNPFQTRGGRLCPSHYCQPPRIQKAIYISEGIGNFLMTYLLKKPYRSAHK